MYGTQGYGENARALADQYESITFADVHRDVLHLFPHPPARVLDVGAGSGRDAAALATRGHRVVAVEPTDSLRAEGMHRHEGKAIEWVDAQLPALKGLAPRAERFDLILLTAVWMHLDEEERQVGMEALASLLAPGGRLSLSLRHGPVPTGRRMFEVPAEETIALASLSGLCLVHSVVREDMLGRADVRWSFVVVEKP
ncbi:class I SAM-dependent methyltransferase [Aureimonas altamirensis]|uniref:class I SAM-dependent methyltransferase n=1 Tax=Aureimonas altamirensis TaxID=370622 RepID=UPI001E51F0A5|nr:class I SAM-dependent methyltransferase [Aureimonas altamirensis]UHD45782.1 class I SAM-dependent methyltransferase [Aureimonas altamirensis]